MAAEVGSVTLNGRPLLYRVVDGHAIADGDMDLGDPASLPARVAITGRLRANSMVVQGNQYLWPNGVIPYVIDGSITNQDRVNTAVQHWNSLTPIQLVPRTSQGDYVIFSRDPQNAICLAQVGRMGGAQTITLADACTTANVIHEIGHAVGLFHEQSRTDRDSYVQVLTDNLDKLQAYQFAAQLPIGDTYQVGANAGAYDYGSIMQYGPFGFSKNGQATTVTIPAGIPIGEAPGLSAGDIVAVRQLYGQSTSGVIITTNPPGLTVTVDGATVTTPQQFNWDLGSTHTVTADTQGSGTTRYVFARWNAATDATQTITVTPDLSVLTAHFVKQLKLTSGVGSGNGTISIDPPSPDGYYPVGTTVSITAQPSDGQKFYWWSGTNYFPTHGLGANPAVFTLTDENISYYANFTSDPLAIVTADTPHFQVVIDGNVRTLPIRLRWQPGSNHTLTVQNPLQCTGTGAIRSKFTGWDDGTAGTSTTKSFDGSGDLNVTVHTTSQYYVGSGVSLSGAGAVVLSPASADGYYDHGTQVTIQ